MNLLISQKNIILSSLIKQIINKILELLVVNKLKIKLIIILIIC